VTTAADAERVYDDYIQRGQPQTLRTHLVKVAVVADVPRRRRPGDGVRARHRRRLPRPVLTPGNSARHGGKGAACADRAGKRDLRQ